MNRRPHQKQGLIDFNAFFLVIVALLLVSLFFMRVSPMVRTDQATVGQLHGEVITTIEAEEQTRYFIDQAAQLSIRNALTTLFDQGGFIQNPCGQTSGYSNWNTADNNCLPTTLDEQLRTLINTNMDEHAQRYQQQTGIELPRHNYELYRDPTTLRGIALTPVRIPIKAPATYIPVTLLGIEIGREEAAGRLIIGRDFLNPSFTYLAPTDLDLFDIGTAFARMVLAQCPQTTNVNACITEQVANLKTTGVNIESSASGTTTLFRIKSTQTKRELRFALTLPVRDTTSTPAPST